MKQKKLIFNFFVNRNWKNLTDSRKRAKILDDNRKSHHPIETLFHMNHWKKINLSLRSFETGNLSADNFKKIFRPRWVDTWAHGTIMWYWWADTLLWQLSINHNIDEQLVFSWARKLAKKCESKHWFLCGVDGRSFGVRSRDYQKSGMGRFP